MLIFTIYTYIFIIFIFIIHFMLIFTIYTYIFIITKSYLWYSISMDHLNSFIK